MWAFFWITVIGLGLGLLKSYKEEGEVDDIEALGFIYAVILFTALLVYFFNTGEDFLDN